MPQTLLSSDKDSLKDSKHEEDKQEENKLLYKGAFDEFDWNKNGTIPTRVKHLGENCHCFMCGIFRISSTP